jgi:hypothetical protein
MRKAYLPVCVVTLLLLALALSISCAAKNKTSASAPRGQIAGMVIDSISGQPVNGATIKLLLGSNLWSATTSDSNGAFAFYGAPAASRLILEFSGKGYCPMNFDVETTQAEHTGQLTDLLLSVVRADASLNVILSANGAFMPNIAISLQSMSYVSLPATATTNAQGLANFSVGSGQSYTVSAPPVEINNNPADEYTGASVNVDIHDLAVSVFIDLTKSPPNEMKLISQGVKGDVVTALFTEPIASIDVLDGQVYGNATLNQQNPAAVRVAGNQAVLTPNVVSGQIVAGDSISFTVRAQGAQTQTWWDGPIEYVATDDDDDDDDDDDTVGITCTEAYMDMYTTCSLFFEDGSGNEIPLDSVIAACEAGTSPYALDDACGICIVDNYDDCTAMETCLASCVSGGAAVAG